MGRWLSRDLIEEDGGIGLYILQWNNAINLFDFIGLYVIGDIEKHKPEFFKESPMPHAISSFVDVLYDGGKATKPVPRSLIFTEGEYYYHVQFVPRFTPPCSTVSLG